VDISYYALSKGCDIGDGCDQGSHLVTNLRHRGRGLEAEDETYKEAMNSSRGIGSVRQTSQFREQRDIYM
jgi:hypothetical protein